MDNTIKINADVRNEKGKKIAKKLRKEAKIPAVIYGGQAKAINVAVNLPDIKAILKSESGENSIFQIIPGKSAHIDAMFKDIQYNPISRSILHVDFIRIDLNKPVNVDVPLVLAGEPIGVKLEDGILDFVTREVQIRCLPTKIMHEIKIDISSLHIGQSIKVENLPVSEDYQYISNANTVICAIISKEKEEKPAIEEVAVEATAEAAAPAAAAATTKESKKEE